MRKFNFVKSFCWTETLLAASYVAVVASTVAGCNAVVRLKYCLQQQQQPKRKNEMEHGIERKQARSRSIASSSLVVRDRDAMKKAVYGTNNAMNSLDHTVSIVVFMNRIRIYYSKVHSKTLT